MCWVGCGLGWDGVELCDGRSVPVEWIFFVCESMAVAEGAGGAFCVGSGLVVEEQLDFILVGGFCANWCDFFVEPSVPF